MSRMACFDIPQQQMEAIENGNVIVLLAKMMLIFRHITHSGQLASGLAVWLRFRFFFVDHF